MSSLAIIFFIVFYNVLLYMFWLLYLLFLFILFLYSLLFTFYYFHTFYMFLYLCALYTVYKYICTLFLLYLLLLDLKAIVSKSIPFILLIYSAFISLCLLYTCLLFFVVEPSRRKNFRWLYNRSDNKLLESDHVLNCYWWRFFNLFYSFNVY